MHAEVRTCMRKCTQTWCVWQKAHTRTAADFGPCWPCKHKCTPKETADVRPRWPCKHTRASTLCTVGCAACVPLLTSPFQSLKASTQRMANDKVSALPHRVSPQWRRLCQIMRQLHAQEPEGVQRKSGIEQG